MRPPPPPSPREVARNHEPNSHGTPVAAHVCETDPQNIETLATYELSPNHDPPKRHTSNLHQCQLLQRLLDLHPLRRGHRRGVRRHGLLLRAQRADNGAGHPADAPKTKTTSGLCQHSAAAEQLISDGKHAAAESWISNRFVGAYRVFSGRALEPETTGRPKQIAITLPTCCDFQGQFRANTL